MTTPNPREERGRAIAETQTLVQKGNSWVVPSQSGNGKYTVFPDVNKCTCPDCSESGFVCKHVFAVRFTISRTTQEVAVDGTETTTTETVAVTKTVAVRKTYPQDWPRYDAAMANERRHFHALLADLCSVIPEPAKNRSKGGRPSIPLKDGLFAACLKVYSLMSVRRFNGELEEAHERGYIERLPHYNHAVDILDKSETTALLKTMIETSAVPLIPVESKFAVDSTGFATTSYSRWFDQKHGVPKKYARFVKAHFATGCLTNVVTSVDIDHQDANDSPFLPPLVKKTAELGFNMKEVTGDCAYASNQNFNAVDAVGGTFYPMFKANATGACGGLFEKAFHTFSLNKEAYLSHYHVRSNVESTVSMIKRKFGDGVKAKNELAQKNEVFAKFVCHNICVLIQEMYVQGIDPTFGRDEQESQPTTILKFPRA
jgi:transposase